MTEAYLVAIIVGLTEAVKMAGMPSKYLPLVATVLGVALYVGWTAPTLINVILGAGMGLAATGLVNRIDHVVEKTATENY